MQATDSLQELTVFIQKNSGKILSGQCNLALTTHTLAHLNRCFKQSEEESLVDSRSHDNDQSRDRRRPQTIVFLLSYVRKTPALKLIHPTSTLHGPVEISRFKNLTMLEFKKVPVHMLNGLGSLRHQLQVLICSRCIQSLQNLLCSCGGDMLSEAPWSSLHTLNLSYNHIDALDDSLRLLPVLKMLNLSHNEIKHTRDYLECLSELAHLNLGYNHLERVPALGLVARTNLQTLVLRNNSLDNLSGLEDYSSLLELDLGNNCLYEGAELRTMGYLHNLREINLLGNPLAFDPAYRSVVVSKFPPEGASRKMYLDGVPLTSTEYQMIPTVSLSKPIVRVPSLASVDTTGSNFFNEVSSFDESIDLDKGKRAKGKRVPKVRHVSIPDQDVSKDDAKSRVTMLHDSDIEETKQELEKMRRLHGADWLLALQAPYRESPHSSASETEKNVERAARPRVTRTNSLGPGSSGIESDIDSITNGSSVNADKGGSSDIDKNIDIKIGNYIGDVIEQAAAPVSEASRPESGTPERQLGVVQTEVLLEKNSKPLIFLERSGSDMDAAIDSPWTEAAPEDEEHELCSPLLVTLQHPGQDKPVHLFLTVKETHLEERDLNGHVTERLEIKCLRSMQHTCESVWIEETGIYNIVPVINLTFDYIRRDRKKREYILEDEESYQILSNILQPFLDENRLAASTQKAMVQCLKCSLEFGRHQAKRRLMTRQRGNLREEDSNSDIESWMNEVPVCPSCNSDLIVELESPISPSDHTSTVNTPTGSISSLEMNTRPTATSSPWKLKDKETGFLSSTEKSKSGSSTEYHSAANSLSSSPAQGFTTRPAINSSSSGTSTLVNSSSLPSPQFGRQRHITEETIDDETSEISGSSYQPQEGQSIESNYAFPDPTIRMSRGDETNSLENISTYQHEKLQELLQHSVAPFSQKYSLVPSDILDVSSREASGANTPRSGEPADRSSNNYSSKSSHPDSSGVSNTSQSRDNSLRTKNTSNSLSPVKQRTNGSQESLDRIQNSNSRPCSEDDIVILPAEKSNNEQLNVSFNESNDSTQDAFSYETSTTGVGRAGSTDSEIAVLRNNSIDAISFASDSVFDSSLNAAQTNLANALSDAASKPEVSNSSTASIDDDSPNEIENSGVFSTSVIDKSNNEDLAWDANGKKTSASAQISHQSSSSKESSMTMSFEGSVNVSVPKTHSMIDNRDGDFANVDHRLKLYFSMSLFGSSEELACMTKCRIFQFSKSLNFFGLIVVSTHNIYIMKIAKEESEKPSDLLSKRSQHSIRDLLHVHVGPGSQGFQLDFNNEGVLYTIVMRDVEKCEAFVTQFEKTVQQAPVGKKRRFKGVVRNHPNTTMNIMSHVIGESMGDMSTERETEITLYLLAYHKVTKEVKRALALDLLPISILVTPADLYLAEENHFWPLRQTKTKGQTKMPQFTLKDHHKITDVGEMELYEDAPSDIAILFFHEDTAVQSQWHIQMENTSSLIRLMDAIKTPWKEMFGVDLKQTIHPSVTIEMHVTDLIELDRYSMAISVTGAHKVDSLD